MIGDDTLVDTPAVTGTKKRKITGGRTADAEALLEVMQPPQPPGNKKQKLQPAKENAKENAKEKAAKKAALKKASKKDPVSINVRMSDAALILWGAADNELKAPWTAKVR